jgi:hypothetical protein
MEEIRVNILELASELAHKELVKDYSDSIVIYEDDQSGITHYTDEAQDVFNDLYDKYFTFVEQFKI